MPQTNLLAYFSKPVTATAWNPRGSNEANACTGDDCDAADSTRPSTTADIGTAREQSLRISAPDYQPELNPQHHKSQTVTNMITKTGLRFETSMLNCVNVQGLPEATISPVLKEHLPAIRRLTSTTLPIRYSEAFFSEAVTNSTTHQISRVAVYENEPVGWIRCRLEPGSSNPGAPMQIYIQALAVLSPYRNLGLATCLLNEVLSSASSMPEGPSSVYAHVWAKNEDILDWYDKRGFKRVMLLERYYLKLRPSGAWIVRRELESG